MTATYDAIQAYINRRIDMSTANGIDPVVAKEIWSEQDHTNLKYTRNPDCWLTGVDLSGCAVYTSSGDPNKKTCTMITPSCGAVAAHYPLSNGTKVRFVTPSGEVITRTVVKGMKHPDYKPPGETYADLFIVKLDEPVTGCKPLFMLPDDWQEYLQNNGKELMVVQMCQHEHAGLAMIDHIENSFKFLHCMPVPGMFPNSFTLQKFAENLIGGDSSDPCIMLYQGQPILMTVWRYGGYGAGVSIAGQSAWIDETCQTLAGEVPNRINFKPKCSIRIVADTTKKVFAGVFK